MAVRPCSDHCVSVMTALSTQRLSDSSLCDLALAVHVPPVSSAAGASGCGATRRRKKGVRRELCRGNTEGAGADTAGGAEGVGVAGGAEGELVVLLPCHRAVLAACSPLFRDAVFETHGDVEDGGGGVKNAGTHRWGHVWEHEGTVADEGDSAERNDRAASAGSDFYRVVWKEELTNKSNQTTVEKDGCATRMRNNGISAVVDAVTVFEEGETPAKDAKTIVNEVEEDKRTEGESELKEEEAVPKNVTMVAGERVLISYELAEKHNQAETERTDPETDVTEEEEPVKDVEAAARNNTPAMHLDSLSQWIPRLRPGVAGRWLCELPPSLGPLAVSRLLDFAYQGRLDPAAAHDRQTLHAAQVLHMSGAIAACMESPNVAADRSETVCSDATIVATVDSDDPRSSSTPDETRGTPASRRGRPRGRPRSVPVLCKDLPVAEDPRAANDVPAPAESNTESPTKSLRASRKMTILLVESKLDQLKTRRGSRRMLSLAKSIEESPPKTPRVARKVQALVESKEELPKTTRVSRKVPVLAETKQESPVKTVARATRKTPVSEDTSDESLPPAKTPRAAIKVSPTVDQPELPGSTAADASLQNPQELSNENDGATMNVASAAPDADGAAGTTDAGAGIADGRSATVDSDEAAPAAVEEPLAEEDAGDGRKKTISRKSAAATGSRQSGALRRSRARTTGGGDARAEEEKEPKPEPGGMEETETSAATSPTPGKCEEKRHQCTECSKSYTSRKQLELHTSVKHRNEGLCMCDMCGVTLGTRQGLQMHIKTQHKNERTFVCEFCGQRYGQRTGLMIHRRKHTGERPFPCSVCGKDFMSRGTLAKHQRTHTGERPFPCDRCGRGFADRGSLVRHEQSVHSDGPLLSCTLCYKSFKSGDQLRAHLRRHTGQRKFNCSLCEYKFTRQAHLRRHMEVHGRVTDYCPQTRRLRTTGPDSQDEGAAATAAATTASAATAAAFSQLQLQQHLSPGTAFTVPVAGQPSLLTYTITPSALCTSQSLALAVDLLNEVGGEPGEVAVEEVEEVGDQEQHERQQQQLLQLQQQLQEQLQQQQQQQEEEEQQVAEVATVAGGDDPGVALLLKLAEQNPGDVFVLMQS